MKQKNRREKKRRSKRQKNVTGLSSHLKWKGRREKKWKKRKKNRTGMAIPLAVRLIFSHHLRSDLSSSSSSYFSLSLFLSLLFFRFPYGTRRCLTTASKSALSVRHLRFRLQTKKDVQGRTPKWPWGGGSEKSFLFYLFYFWRNIFNDARRSLMDALFFGTRLISKFKKKSRNFVAFNFYSDSNEWNCLETLNYSKLR